MACAAGVFLMCVAVAGAICVTGLAAAEGRASERQGNAEAKKIKNPIPSDASSIEEGRKIYARNCASCHGPGGKGDGSMALGGSTPADLTDDKWDHGSSDGEIFVVIRDGVSADMEGYKYKLTEKQILQV